MAGKDRYREAGVDIEKGNQFVKNIGEMVRSTHSSSVLTDIGGFSGLFSLHTEHTKDPVLVTSTDGVGTKLKLAFLLDKHDTVGIDLVAMCVNDIIVCGAKPLLFLDYFATGKLKLETASQVVSGIVEGCRQAGCALIGGETAEMPGMYADGEYDLAGFTVGLVDRHHIIDGSEIRPGDAVIGIASSGLHSNGYSLVRKIVLDEMKLDLESKVEDLPNPVGLELLTPTKIYAESVSNLTRDFQIGGMANITGGGLLENLPRVLPVAIKAVVKRGSWDIPPVFSFLQKAGGLDEDEMLRTFNSGLGMVIVVKADECDDVMGRLKALGETAFVIGETQVVKNGGAKVELVD